MREGTVILSLNSSNFAQCSVSLQSTTIIQVNDIKAAIADLKSKNIHPLDPNPKIGAHGLPVVFLHPKDCFGVLLELEEFTGEEPAHH